MAAITANAPMGRSKAFTRPLDPAFSGLDVRGPHAEIATGAGVDMWDSLWKNKFIAPCPSLVGLQICDIPLKTS